MKSECRKRLKRHRATLQSSGAGQALIEHFPSSLSQSIIAGFAPIGNEIDLWPLLSHLHDKGRTVCLPVVEAPATPLTFRRWTPDCEMMADRYGVSYPAKGDVIQPELILVPLLAITARGERLGYGGGYYDRTLASLRSSGDVFACGVAYAGQETADLPVDVHDQPLDGILTEAYFKVF